MDTNYFHFLKNKIYTYIYSKFGPEIHCNDCSSPALLTVSRDTSLLSQVCIDKVLTLPSALDPVHSPHLAAVRDLLSYIFDRRAALLPGYFIVNEILKSYPGESMSWPHPSLVPMVAAFLDSFRPTAQMVTTVARHRMRPIVEMTGRTDYLEAKT